MNPMEYTPSQEKIARQLSRMHRITHGIGDNEENACSMVAINLALFGRFTDGRPPCVSPVIHRWVIKVQDKMPEEMLQQGDPHGDRWHLYLPFVAGTNDGKNDQRIQLILDWMWDCLANPDGSVPDWVPRGAHTAWATMLTQRNAIAAHAAADAIINAATAIDAIDAAAAARAAAAAARAAARAAITAIDAAARAADVAADTAARVTGVNDWQRYDPAKLLKQLVTV